MCKNTALERFCTYIQPHPVKKAQHLQSTMLKITTSKSLNTYKPTMHEAPHRKGLCTYKPSMHELPHQKGHALTSDHGVTNPTIASEWPLVPD